MFGACGDHGFGDLGVFGVLEELQCVELAI